MGYSISNFRNIGTPVLIVSNHIKRSYKDLSCRFCQSGEDETQEHLGVCIRCEFERRGLKNEDVCEK